MEIDVDGFAAARDGGRGAGRAVPEEFAGRHVPGPVNLPLPGMGAAADRYVGQRVVPVRRAEGGRGSD